MVSWIWVGGLILTLGTVLAVLPERKGNGRIREADFPGASVPAKPA